jgi:septal ring factor EnvC (AmiA/AmiB activator)
MAVTVEDLDRRATALERAQNETTETLRWAAGTLGRMQAVQDDHTQRLQRVETTLSDHTQRLERVEAKLGDHTQRLERVEATLAEHTQRLGRLEAKMDAFPRAVAEQLEATERRLLAAIARR